MQWKNNEGYIDTTAAVAIQRTARKERLERKAMAKRERRKDEAGIKIHDKAVKMRKMTDEQLVDYVENRVAKAKSEGRNEVLKNHSVKAFLDSLGVPGAIPGIGRTTVDKIIEFALGGGYLG